MAEGVLYAVEHADEVRRRKAHGVSAAAERDARVAVAEEIVRRAEIERIILLRRSGLEKAHAGDADLAARNVRFGREIGKRVA